MRYAVMIIVLVVVFTLMGLVAAWGTMTYLGPVERPDEIVPLVFAFFPLGGAAVGLVVGAVAATVGLVSDRQRARVAKDVPYEAAWAAAQNLPPGQSPPNS